MNRYNYAALTVAEKAVFTSLSKMVKPLSHLSERTRELEGLKSWVKFKLTLKENNPHIHMLEVGVKKGEIANLRFVVAKPTHKSDFWHKMEKLGFKGLYGNVVLHIDCDEKTAQSLLEKVNTLAEESDVITLDPKRTYCDPPQGWIADLTGREGIISKEVKEPEAEEVATPPKAEEAPTGTNG